MTSYDEVPYTSYPFARTHPDSLCTIAELFGMQPASATDCRVLELGCASGGNLIPMAEFLPRSEFVGLDASARQVQTGRALLSETGLSNVRLEHADILDVDQSWGTFDYIICHGVYSWVPPATRAKILEIMREQLRPMGVGYLSYNVYPGWHMRESIRHMMRYHVRNRATPDERVSQARALVDFLATHVPPSDGPYALLLQRELQVLSNATPEYLLHEHLEDVNQPVYFHELAERLDRAGLAYLGEAEIHTMFLQQYAPAAAEMLSRIAPDLVSLEQYMDFVRNRLFRCSLICHKDVPLVRTLSPSFVEKKFVSFAPSAKQENVDLSPGVPQELASRDDVRLTSDRALTKAALVVLRTRWPKPLPFEQLYEEACALLAKHDINPETAVRGELSADLLECYLGGAGVLLRSWAPPIADRPGDRPCASRTARAAAASGAPVATLLHGHVHLDRGPAHILRLLDGTRDEAALIESLADLVEAGELDLTRDEQPIRGREEMRQPLAAVLRTTLPALAKDALLLATE